MMASAADRHLSTMALLTFATGIADAIGYLRLDQVFTANMTGNVVLLGMVVAGRIGPALGNLIALLLFFGGAWATGRMLRGTPKGWGGRVRQALVVEAVILAGAGVWLLLAPAELPVWLIATFTALLAAAFGVQAAAARVVGVKEMTTVVVTSTFTGLATGLATGEGRGGPVLRRRLTSLGTMALGALLGSAAHAVHLDGLGVLVCAVVVLAAIRHGERRERAVTPAPPRP